MRTLGSELPALRIDDIHEKDERFDGTGTLEREEDGFEIVPVTQLSTRSRTQAWEYTLPICTYKHRHLVYQGDQKNPKCYYCYLLVRCRNRNTSCVSFVGGLILFFHYFSVILYCVGTYR